MKRTYSFIKLLPSLCKAGFYNPSRRNILGDGAPLAPNAPVLRSIPWTGSITPLFYLLLSFCQGNKGNCSEKQQIKWGFPPRGWGFPRGGGWGLYAPFS